MATAAGPPVGPEQLRAHAAQLDRLRVRLGQVRLTGRQIEKGQTAFGALCGWILTGLGDRYQKHDELLAYVEETLVLTVRGLRRVAAGEQPLAEMVGQPDESSADEDAPSAPEIIDGVLEAVNSRDWVEPLLAEAAPVAEFATPVTGVFMLLRTGGLEYATTHVEPLRRLLDDLTGTPEVVADQAGHWDVMAGDLRRLASDLEWCLAGAFPGPERPDVRAYLDIMANNVEALRGLAATSTAMTLITRSAGDLILLARDIVRGLIGDLFARASLWVIDSPEVVTRPVLVARLASLVTAAWRINAYVTALTTSIANLSRSIDG
ncbi:hypothetical protein KZ829_24580 [Actinoplanes hulinensis]|uniref:Uncharacterized protein n=1 Tax=Actinoplanes hulinensis TaxID=1144547 RepID=A0ABS7B7I2_9ACTN|nr:hypothetical protein [Actinoplanes hulinensis]MBW6436923.1 hypothetical protein [Actinoplanes hulinensis]